MTGRMGPSALIEQYENLLISNLGAVQSIESGLRNVSWLLPGRFQDAELASEGLYALLNVVSGYHDSLLSKHLDPALSLPPHPFAAPKHAGPSSPSTSTPTQPGASGRDPSAAPAAPKRTTPTLPPPSDHARYTKYWTARSGVYRKASRMLVTIGYIELLVEMVAKKKLGDRRRWNFVLGMEGIKTFLRLILLAVTKRPVLSHPAPQREYDLLSLPSSLLQAPRSGKASTPTLSSGSHSAAQTTEMLDGGSQSGEQIAAAPSGAITTTLPPFAPLRSHLFPLLGALPEDHQPHPLTLLPQLTPAQTISEIIESSVTLVHVFLLLRAAKRRPSHPGKYSLPTLSSPLSPFAIPLALSLLARYLRQTSPAKTVLQSEHNAGRDRQLAMRAFVTGPMWVGWTRPKIMGIVKTLERVPLVGLVGDLVEGYIPLVDEYFYYSS